MAGGIINLSKYRSLDHGTINKTPVGKPNTYGADRTGEIASQYMIRILGWDHRNQSYDMVRAYLSEEYRESVVSSWENIVRVETNIVDTFMTTFTDKTLKSMAMFRLAWKGNEPFRLRFNLIFDATPMGNEADSYDTAKEYVVLPIRALQKMASPYEGALWTNEKGEKRFRVISPPLAAFQDPSSGGITIGIGEAYEYVGCVLTSVSPTFSNVFSETGFPVHAEVELEFQMTQPVLKEDYDYLLGNR